MHVVDGASVGVEVALDRRLLGCNLLARAALAPTISAAAEPAHEEVHEEFENWVVEVEHHCANQNVTDSLEPHGVEVRKRSRGEAEGDRLFSKVSVDQKK